MNQRLADAWDWISGDHKSKHGLLALVQILGLVATVIATVVAVLSYLNQTDKANPVYRSEAAPETNRTADERPSEKSALPFEHKSPPPTDDVAKSIAKAEAEQAAADEAAAEEAAALEAASSMEMSRYVAEVVRKVKASWMVLPGDDNLTCTLRVTLSKAGEVEAIEVIKASSNLSFDRRAENAVRKAAPFAVPTEPRLYQRLRKFTFDFTPERASS